MSRSMAAGKRPRSTLSLFIFYAAIAAVPVVALGGVLAARYRAEARRRGLDQGRAEAVLVAETTVEPLLDGHPLASGLTPTEDASFRRLLDRARRREVLRLRLRGLDARVVFSDDGSGFNGPPDDEALDAARGSVVALLTHLNADRNDIGPRGVPAVEVYVPLRAGNPARRIGVLEMYLPYAPISADINAGLHGLYRGLAIGFTGLYIVLLVIAISANRRLRKQVAANAYLAEHDTLTDLPNRTLFHRRAREAVESARVRDHPVVLALMDLDRFKDVNDALGHHNGDQLLTELARRLAAHTRSEDTVARLGGDEFGIVLRDGFDVETVLGRLRDVIEEDVEVSGLPLSVAASIGYVVAPSDGTDVDELLQRADVAMYIAKADHLGVIRYDPAQDHYDAAELSLVAELRHAIDEGQLVLHYQPMTRIEDGSTEVVEALVRWEHPRLGLLPPARFLPVVEQTDLIDKLTDWVLARALTDLRGLGSNAAELSVAVNVSARNLARSDFADRVAAALADAEVSPRRLILEITETALVTNPNRAAVVLASFERLGVRVSLDDFGRGQTSLGYLSAFPLHELKIDQSFVSDMSHNRAHAAIVRSIVDLGHNLELRVVGEGVESAEVLDALAAMGCDVAQGYLFARPMPADALRKWLAIASRREEAIASTP